MGPQAMNLNGKMQHPAITGTIILSVIGLAAGGFSSVNSLENQVQANEGEIKHQKELRQAENSRIKSDLKDLKEDSKEIKQLINQLILR